MGAGRGKIVEIKQHNLVANSDFANMGEVTQYHDHDEYLKQPLLQKHPKKSQNIKKNLRKKTVWQL